MGKVPFDDWWSAHVFLDDRKATLSRKDLVLTAANQDGGAHVDPALNETYARLSKDNSLGWVASGSEGEQPIPGPEKAALRQVAHEVIKTLKPGYERKIKYDAEIVAGGMMMIQGPTNSPIHPTFSKVGRNEKCPCGSGKKYKKCHGV